MLFDFISQSGIVLLLSGLSLSVVIIPFYYCSKRLVTLFVPHIKSFYSLITHVFFNIYPVACQRIQKKERKEKKKKRRIYTYHLQFNKEPLTSEDIMRSVTVLPLLLAVASARIVNFNRRADNLQTFTGDLGGAAPAVTNSGDSTRPFEVNGDTFVNEAGALQRSCDVQFNTCANQANGGASFSVAQCQQQEGKYQDAQGTSLQIADLKSLNRPMQRSCRCCQAQYRRAFRAYHASLPPDPSQSQLQQHRQ